MGSWGNKDEEKLIKKTVTFGFVDNSDSDLPWLFFQVPKSISDYM